MSFRTPFLGFLLIDRSNALWNVSESNRTIIKLKERLRMVSALRKLMDTRVSAIDRSGTERLRSWDKNANLTGKKKSSLNLPFFVGL